jgi:hypothetical protein
VWCLLFMWSDLIFSSLSHFDTYFITVMEQQNVGYGNFQPPCCKSVRALEWVSTRPRRAWFSLICSSGTLTSATFDWLIQCTWKISSRELIFFKCTRLMIYDLMFLFYGLVVSELTLVVRQWCDSPKQANV